MKKHYKVWEEGTSQGEAETQEASDASEAAENFVEASCSAGEFPENEQMRVHVQGPDDPHPRLFVVQVDFDPVFTAEEIDTLPPLVELGISPWETVPAFEDDSVCYYLGGNPLVAAATVTKVGTGNYSWRAYPTPKHTAFGHLNESLEEAQTNAIRALVEFHRSEETPEKAPPPQTQSPQTLEELGIDHWRSTVIHGEAICHYLEGPQNIAAIVTPEDDGSYSWRAYPTPNSEVFDDFASTKEEAQAQAIQAIVDFRAIGGTDDEDEPEPLQALHNIERAMRVLLTHSSEISLVGPDKHIFLGGLHNIERAMRVLLTHSSEISLVGLDKHIFLGGPHPDELPESAKEELEECGVCWEADQEAWTYYTGHG